MRKTILIMMAIFLVFALSFTVTNPVYGSGEKSTGKAVVNQEATEKIENEIGVGVEDETSLKRKKILSNAVAAVSETRKALKALEEERVDDALAALEIVTGKLELILARDPELALAPMDVKVATYDIYATLDSIENAKKQVEDYLEDGEVQMARSLLKDLASEIVISVYNIPLITYPDAIKAVAPLIDDGKIDEAKQALQAALNTLVVTNNVIPLPILRAEHMLEEAESLAEDEDRTKEDNEKLSKLLEGTHHQLKMAEALGYGNKEAYEKFHKQLDEITEKTEGGKGGEGFLDEILEGVSRFKQSIFD